MIEGNEITTLPRVVTFEQRSIHGGTQVQVRFDNGYGISVVNHRGSYGLEAAVLHGFVGEGVDKRELCYSTPITNDVVKYIRDQAALGDLARQVMELPSNPQCDHARPDDWLDDEDTLEVFTDTLDSLRRMLL